MWALHTWGRALASLLFPAVVSCTEVSGWSQPRRTSRGANLSKPTWEACVYYCHLVVMSISLLNPEIPRTPLRSPIQKLSSIFPWESQNSNQDSASNIPRFRKWEPEGDFQVSVKLQEHSWQHLGFGVFDGNPKVDFSWKKLLQEAGAQFKIRTERGTWKLLLFKIHVWRLPWWRSG